MIFLVLTHPLSSRQSRSCSRRSINGQGFTLVELLIAAAILGIGIAAAARVAITQIRMDRTYVGAQTADSIRSRLAFIIDSDFAESRSVEPSITVAGCPDAAGQSFALTVPFFNSVTGVVEDVPIVYANVSGNLVRCGPAINANGSIDFSSTLTTVVVAPNVQIAPTPQFNATNTSVSFNLGLPAIAGAPASNVPMSFGTRSFRVVGT